MAARTDDPPSNTWLTLGCFGRRCVAGSGKDFHFSDKAFLRSPMFTQPMLPSSSCHSIVHALREGETVLSALRRIAREREVATGGGAAAAPLRRAVGRGVGGLGRGLPVPR